MIWMQFLIDNLESISPDTLESIKQSLKKDKDLGNVKIDELNHFVYLASSLSSVNVMKKLNTLGLIANVHGQGSTLEKLSKNECAVGVFLTDDVEAIIRLIQVENDKIFIDGSLIRLPKGKFRLAVHKFGDISKGADSCGEMLYDLGSFDDTQDSHQKICEFTIPSVIARSILLFEEDRGCIAYSVIARSSGVSQNVKKVCKCNPVE
jgi:hypothetical protein